jgi:hypothetical protein
MKRLLAIWGAVGAPTVDHRWGGVWDRLTGDGWEVERHPILSGWEAFTAARRAEVADAVLVYGPLRNASHAWREWIVFDRARKVVFDLDAAHYRGEWDRDPLRRRIQRKMIQRLCRNASLVFTGNAALRDFAFRRNRNAVLLPTGVDAGRLRLRAPHRADDGPTLGWWGDRRAVPALEELRPILKNLARRWTELKIIVWTQDGPPITLGDVRVERRPWTPTPPVDLAGITVTLSPLPFGAWAEGTCAEWPLSALAAGAPVVATPRGGQADVITDGVDGFFARDLSMWEERLSTLLLSPDLRNKIAERGRDTVRRHFSPDVLYPVFRRTLEAMNSDFPI